MISRILYTTVDEQITWPNRTWENRKFNDKIIWPYKNEYITDEKTGLKYGVMTFRGELTELPETDRVYNDGYFKSNNNITSFTLPTTITRLPTGFCFGCSNLETVNFEELNIESVGYAAFYRCTKLTNLDMSGWSNLKVLGDSGFEECGLLQCELDFTRHPKLEVIERTVFRYTPNVTGGLDFSKCPNLVSIGVQAFQNCTNLTGGVFFDGCNSLQMIGDAAFERCSNMSGGISFEGCSNLQKIGAYAFKDCSGLLGSINFEGCINLHTIEREAFKFCYSLSGDISFEGCSNLQTIGDEVFKDCSGLSGNLSSFEGYTNLHTIGNSAFQNCSNLSGELSFKGCTSLQSIGNSAFQNCSNLSGELSFKGFTNLQMIGDSAFERCSNMTGNISFEGCSNLQTIGRNAFHELHRLRNFIFTGCSSLTNIDNGAFDNTCNNLEDGETGQIIGLEDCVNLVRIGESAFAWTRQLSGDIDFGALPKLEEIGYRAFIETGAKNITFDGCNNLKIIGWEAFQNCTGSITFGECENLETIMYGSFLGCLGIEGKLDLTGCPNLTLIDSRAFESCSNITELDLSNCTKLEKIGDTHYGFGKNTFRYCNKITYVNLTNCKSLTTIGSTCFEQCDLLEYVNFTNCNSLQYMEGSAFALCYSLKHLNFTNCNSLSRFEANVFLMNLPIETIDIAPLATWINIQYDNGWAMPMIAKPVHFYLDGELLEHVVIPKGSTTIGKWAFYNGIDIKTVELHEDIEDIGDEAFRYCRNLQNVVNFNEVLSKFTEIKPRIFANCDSLSNEIDFTLYENLVSIGDGVFDSCSNLKGTFDFSKCTKLETIGNDTFNNCTSVEGSIDLSGCKQLMSIGQRSFKNCTGITGPLDFSHNPNLTEIKDNAFQGCNKIESLSFKNCSKLTTIGFGVFDGCTGLTSEIDFSDCTELESIGATAFAICGIKGTLDFSNTKITIIPNRLCMYSQGLSGLIIGPNVTEIDYSAFHNCKFQNVDFSTAINLIKIGEGAFGTATLGGVCDLRNTKLIQVDRGAFASSYLTEARFPSTLEILGENTFSGFSLTLLETPIMPINNNNWNGSGVQTLILNGDTVLNNLRVFFPTPNQGLNIYVKPELLNQYQEMYDEWNGRFHEISEYTE